MAAVSVVGGGGGGLAPREVLNIANPDLREITRRLRTESENESLGDISQSAAGLSLENVRAACMEYPETRREIREAMGGRPIPDWLQEPGPARPVPVNPRPAEVRVDEAARPVIGPHIDPRAAPRDPIPPPGRPVHGGAPPRPVRPQPAPQPARAQPAREPSLVTDGQVEDFFHLSSRRLPPQQALDQVLGQGSNLQNVLNRLNATQLSLFKKTRQPDFRMWVKPDAQNPHGLTDHDVYLVKQEVSRGVPLEAALRTQFPPRGGPQALSDKTTFLAALNYRGVARIETINPRELYLQGADGRTTRTSTKATWHSGQRVREVTQHEKLSRGWRTGYVTGTILGTLCLGIPWAFESFRNFAKEGWDGETHSAPEHQALNPADENYVDPELGYNPDGDLAELQARFARGDNNVNDPFHFHKGTQLEVNKYYRLGNQTFLYLGQGTILLAPNGNRNALMTVTFTAQISDDKATSGKPLEGKLLLSTMFKFVKGASDIHNHMTDNGHRDGLMGIKTVYFDEQARTMYVSDELSSLSEKPDLSQMTKLQLPQAVWKLMGSTDDPLEREREVERLRAQPRPANNNHNHRN